MLCLYMLLEQAMNPQIRWQNGPGRPTALSGNHLPQFPVLPSNKFGASLKRRAITASLSVSQLARMVARRRQPEPQQAARLELRAR
jgi:hypothetical protein